MGARVSASEGRKDAELVSSTRTAPLSTAARMPAESPLFSLRHVSQCRGGRQVLRELTLDIHPRCVTAIIGPSGSGKTTLLRLLNRLDDPTEGQIELEGRSLGEIPVAVLRRRVGFVFQTPTMFPGTVEDNLEEARMLGTNGATARASPTRGSWSALLESVGLSAEFGARVAGQLSGGEQQRIGLARTLTGEPEVLLLDEPTAALDPESAAHLLTTIRDLARQRALSIVMVTHRLDEARAFSEHVAMLDEGRLIESGPCANVFANPASTRARAYLLAGR